jgi:aryl-alcohol dehydrogenase-like predicted oxidoreductase
MFDTADVYGNPDDGAAERVLGDALSGVRRGSVEICTKVCMPSGPGANDRGLSRKHVMESCHASLRRLRTDHVDLYQAHRYDDETPLEETMTVFTDLVRQDKVLYLGVSEWRPDQVEAAAALAAELGVPLISNQPQYFSEKSRLSSSGSERMSGTTRRTVMGGSFSRGARSARPRGPRRRRPRVADRSSGPASGVRARAGRR